ncbi:sensor histidine kinase KdpD [Dissulfurimicrobium hydrothermale]|uniref:sensor histidine kinase KdpD n=1 Tax=Dissulfurimicrobium hydrothermale TaxID=1750598 RepID=UPI002ED56884
MEEAGPSPDLLLAQVQEEERRKKEGKLKIFFGAAPGVGKTYAMLNVARKKLAEGADIVVGIVETHGRPETGAMLEGLEIIPRREVEYLGTVLREFDLDAALARRPGIILVDELAHTNAPGSRHKKRWQDVFELLAAGINVYTTLNVQHLESLNDVVAQITGVRVRETLPDSVLDRADDIELIDLPPDELLQRLKEGKVYIPEVAIHARENFFRKGNLLALRELALRRTAERVDDQMLKYRIGKGVKAIWPAAERIMVCIGANPRSIRLIRAARRMAAGLRADWIAVTVEAPSTVKPSKDDLRRLSEHMRLAESLGAEAVILSGHKASEEILNYARSRNVTKLIIGKPTHPRWKDRIFGSLLDEVVRGSGDIDVYVITGDSGEPSPSPIARPQQRRTDAKEWFFSIGIVAAFTVFVIIMRPYLTLVDVAMTYLLGIVLVASRTSKWPSLFATMSSITALDFFFVPPVYTFSVLDMRYFFTFIVMFFVAFVISKLTLRVREQANAARRRERRTAALYRLSRELVHERGIPELSSTIIKHLNEVLSCKVVILVPDEKGALTVPVTGKETFALDQREFSVAHWVFEHRQRAGLGTDTLPGAMALYLPLATSMRTVGVLGILPNEPASIFDQEHIQLLESFANQIAVAFERAFLAEEAQRAVLKAETESLRNTLLSSISHDLRTPLAAITGAATALFQRDINIDQQGMHELISTIYEEAEHLNEIIRNVLDMIRLETKAISVKKEWQSIEEVVGVVLNRLSEKLKDRELKVDIPADLPLVPFDPLLIEQVLMNLLDNAIRYTPAGTQINLTARIKEDVLLVELADRGKGIPAGDEERIFEKFVRGSVAGGGGDRIGADHLPCHC